MQIAGVELEDLEFDSIGSWPVVLRLSLFIIAALIIFYMGFVFYVSDIFDEYNSKKNERITLQHQYEKAYDQASNLEENKKQIVVVKKILDSLTQQLPQNSEQAELLDNLSSLSVANGLNLLSVKPANEEYKGFYWAQSLELFLVGGYHNLGKFVSDVSAISRLITLNDFDIKSTPKDPKRLEMTINAESYWIGNRQNSQTTTTGGNTQGNITPLPGNVRGTP